MLESILQELTKEITELNAHFRAQANLTNRKAANDEVIAEAPAQTSEPISLDALRKLIKDAERDAVIRLLGEFKVQRLSELSEGDRIRFAESARKMVH
jgi:hypothetical protein